MKDVDAEIKEVQKRINDKMGELAWDAFMPLVGRFFSRERL